ncbi:MAG: hypothetical protein E6G70_29245 [Alphaproteobacteria bacterium]|nr:MAG: hypothetical protein E6G70_29245 [Alphaproteobacteria bacterium]
MILKGAFLGFVCAALLASCGASVADGYRPDQFLGLDLSQAVLSPMPLGPTTEFAPVAVEADTDRNSEAWWARNELKTEPRKVAVQQVRAAHVHTVAPVHTAARVRITAPVRNARSQVAVRTKLGRRHGNPLDAQAFDSRVQRWPCKSGGICNWKRSAE